MIDSLRWRMRAGLRWIWLLLHQLNPFAYWANQRREEREFILEALREVTSVLSGQVAAFQEQTRLMRDFLQMYDTTGETAARTTTDAEGFKKHLRSLEMTEAQFYAVHGRY